MKVSEKIQVCIEILEQIDKDYDWYLERLHDSEKEQCNINHAMIGIVSGQSNKKPPIREERNKLATQLQKSLLKRRTAKDLTEVNSHLHEFIVSDDGKRILRELKEVLGKTRKSEKNMDNRVYYERIKVDETSTLEQKQNFEQLLRKWKKDLKQR